MRGGRVWTKWWSSKSGREVQVDGTAAHAADIASLNRVAEDVSVIPNYTPKLEHRRVDFYYADNDQVLIAGVSDNNYIFWLSRTRLDDVETNKAVFDIFGCKDLEEFKDYTGFTFKGMTHPDDYQKISESIETQISSSESGMDFLEYRIIRKDGAVRWVDDYGHYAETKAYGGIYVVFISDITEKILSREKQHKDLDSMITAMDVVQRVQYSVAASDQFRCVLLRHIFRKANIFRIKNGSRNTVISMWIRTTKKGSKNLLSRTIYVTHWLQKIS